MNKAILVFILALASKVYCEPPSRYAYGRPSSNGNFNNHGFSSFGNSLGHGSDYQQVAIGHQNSEGYHIDPQLLHKIKDILIQQENFNGGGYSSNNLRHGLSTSYGPPSHASARVVGIDFARVEQGRQVAQYLKHDSSSSFAPSRSYGPPSFKSYVSRPHISSSYGSPF